MRRPCLWRDVVVALRKIALLPTYQVRVSLIPLLSFFRRQCLEQSKLRRWPVLRQSWNYRTRSSAIYGLGLCGILADDSDCRLSIDCEEGAGINCCHNVVNSEEDECLTALKLNKCHLDDAVRYIRIHLHCSNCSRRIQIDQPTDGISYCRCATSSRLADQSTPLIPSSLDGWEQYIERSGSIVWRKLDKTTGLYAFKLYAQFNDISANEFIELQMDVSDARREWDTSTVHLEVFSTDKKWTDVVALPRFGELTRYRYYWRVCWPKFFADRDYVCERTATLLGSDETNPDGVFIMSSSSVGDERYPANNDAVRVQNYSSVLVVRPTGQQTTKWSAPGVEFCITAYEDPGVNIPTSITTWVAMRALPDYITSLRRSCLEHRQQRQKCAD